MKKIIIIGAGVIVAVGCAVGVHFGMGAAYDSGTKDGREAALTEVAENTQALSSAVADKAEFAVEVSELMNEVPREINAEAIDKYIANLENLVGKVKIDEIRETLAKYLEAWKDFKETYASEDNQRASDNGK